MNDYTKLDAAILNAIRSGKVEFTSIAYNDHIEALAKQFTTPQKYVDNGFRVVDRRLQALRKLGLISFKAKRWSLAHASKQGNNR